MLLKSATALLAAAAACGSAALAGAPAVYPRAGWTATLSTNAHGVSGRVVIVDEDTLRFEMFNYDGAGLSLGVYAYLGEQNTNPSFIAGQRIGPDLRGPAYVDAEFEMDLPPGETLDGWNAVAIWCVLINANFGSGSFVAPSCAADLDGDGAVSATDLATLLGAWGAAGGPSDLSDDGVVNATDLGMLLGAWGPC